MAPDAIPEDIFTSGGCCPGEPLGAALTAPFARMKVFRSALCYSLLDRDPETRTVSAPA